MDQGPCELCLDDMRPECRREHTRPGTVARPIFLRNTLKLRRVAAVILCVGLLLSVSACGWIEQLRPAVGPFDPSPAELARHKEAVDAYLAADYEEAARRFAAIRENADSPTIARMALYGSACSRLMAADTPQAYKEGLALWEAWVRTAPGPGVHEDARLFAPIIKNKMLFSHVPLDPEGTVALEAEHTIPRWFMVQADQELRRLKAQTESDRQHIENRDKKIKALESEIIRLNRQIEAFEQIDQKIQQKKSAIPSAE